MPTEIRILGERVAVFKNGITWVSPVNGRKYMIGRTRVEAVESLRRLKTETERVDSSAKLRALSDPPRVDRARYYSAAHRAKKTGKSIMSPAEYDALVLRAGGRCELTGIQFSNEKVAGMRTAPWAPSLDRIDCSKGYEFENCRLVCTSVNIALNDFGPAVLRRIAMALVTGRDVD